jgi:hypothetical protein
MGDWYTRLRDRLPDAPIVSTLVECVEALPGIQQWSPRHGLETRWTNILHWGHVLWSTASLVGTSELLADISSEILQTDHPNPDSFAELSAAGLCVSFGALDGERLQRASHPIADWRLRWSGEGLVDVEVTTAKRKPAHIRRSEAAATIAERLFILEMEDDVVVHIVDPTDAADADAMLAAARSLAKGGTLEEPGRWQVRREDVLRDVKVIVKGELDARPSWWPARDVRSLVIRGILAGPDSTKAPAQLRIFFGVPYDAYINPVMKKADAPQGTAGHPFLLVVDVMGLAGAMTELPEILPGYFAQWSRISGVLLFTDLVALNRSGWVWRLLANPTAAHPLPASLTDGRANLEQSMETALRFERDGNDSKPCA